MTSAPISYRLLNLMDAVNEILFYAGKEKQPVVMITNEKLIGHVLVRLKDIVQPSTSQILVGDLAYHSLCILLNLCR